MKKDKGYGSSKQCGGDRGVIIMTSDAIIILKDALVRD